MKKSDLKNGQIVELRNGVQYYVIDDKIVNDKGHCALFEYTDTLECKQRSDMDIVNVFNLVDSPRYMAHIKNEVKDIQWQRSEYETIDIDGNKLELNPDNIAKLKVALNIDTIPEYDHTKEYNLNDVVMFNGVKCQFVKSFCCVDCVCNNNRHKCFSCNTKGKNLKLIKI